MTSDQYLLLGLLLVACSGLLASIAKDLAVIYRIDQQHQRYLLDEDECDE